MTGAAGARPHFALFDALRGFAVLGILTFHAASLTGAMGNGFTGQLAQVAGGQAVIVFFAISGFLLYRPFVAAREAGGSVDLRRYARGRVLRIVPAYWVLLTLLAVFPGVAGVFSGDFWRYYGFLQLYSPDAIGRGIPVAWTLCVEVTFYVALPLWALLMRGRSLRQDLVALGGLAAVGAVVQLLAAQQQLDRVIADALPGQLPWLVLGMALAVLSVLHEEGRHAGSRAAAGLAAFVTRAPTACWAAAAAAFVGLALLVPEGGLAGLIAALSRPESVPTALARIVLSGVLAAGFLLPGVFGGQAGGLPRRVLRLAPVAWLGVVSYSFYLLHLTIAQWLWLPADPAHFSASGLGLAEHVGGGGTVVLWGATFALTGVLATLSYRWIELPALRRKGRISRPAAG